MIYRAKKYLIYTSKLICRFFHNFNLLELFHLLLLFFSEISCLFEGLNLLENSWNVAYLSCDGNLHLIWVSYSVWQNCLIVPPNKIAMFPLYVWNWAVSCIFSRTTDKSLGAKHLTQQEFNHFLCNSPVQVQGHDQ